jgi:hypothetical protein
MRDVPRIMEAWRSGVYVGDNRPSTRVTVEKGWTLKPTATVLGTWNKGPARWFQAEDPDLAVQTEIPNVISVTLNRGLDSDAGTCDFVVRNAQMPALGQPEVPAGQFGTSGYFTWDHGASQDAKARWGHTTNLWQNVIVPNALIRTYQGFGGHDKAIDEAVADGDLVLNGMWLIDEIVINTDGTLSVKCRDMGKLLIDQQLFPPLMPSDRYPLDYRRWVYKTVEIPNELIMNDPPADLCYNGRYLASSTDEVYGQWNTQATGHPGTDAFDSSPEPGPDVPGAYAHQWTFWLSEPKASPDDTVWLEFEIDNGNAGDVNEVYYHAWRGAIEGLGVHRVMVSVWENGRWVSPETPLGGITPQGVPYVTTFSPGTELAHSVSTNRYALPRDYRATKIRLTVTSLITGAWEADDFEGYRAGARKIMACFKRGEGTHVRLGMLVLVGTSIPKNDDNRQGYWQVRANGQVFAFGDARVYEPNSPYTGPISTVIGMAVHPSGSGYWYVDIAGRVMSAGDAHWFGDMSDVPRSDVADITATPDGNGYWILNNSGHVFPFGSAVDHGSSPVSGFMPDGALVHATSIEAHPTIDGYWILQSDGLVSAHNVPYHGDANRDGFQPHEWVTSLRHTASGGGYWITSGNGIVQAFGDAPHHGNRDTDPYDAAVWFLGICWELIPSSLGDESYAIQSADGNLYPRGSSVGWSYGSLGSGKMMQRFDGNYKDYSDVVRDLVLWAGFYFYVDPAEGGFPGIYGSIENTGIYAEAPLPKDMFDKKPIIDAIKALKEIVGYAVWIDAEGRFRFESPNWWTIGNFLPSGTDGGERTPFAFMPEIDETQQLMGHQVTRTASQARSRIIISTADPYPAIPGTTPPKGVVTTEIVPRTAPDLRGLVVPAMWINGKFLSKDEQKVMADLIDIRTWLARRTANVSCVANPLIDVNDQVRVIERQSGEVYVHYISSISVKHDLVSGDFRMDLTTHWMGGTPYGAANYFYAAAMTPTGNGYWQATAGGDIFAYGDAKLYDSNEPDSHIETIVGFRALPTGTGYYTLDVSGKILTYGDAIHYGQIYDPDNTVIDLAVTPSGDGYWVLQQTGIVSEFGDAVNYGNADLSPTGPTSTLDYLSMLPPGTAPPAAGSAVSAQSIESHPSTQGYWVLLSNGLVQAFNLPHHGDANRAGFEPSEYVSSLRATVDGGGYYIPSGGGDRVQVFGNAVDHGAGTQYPDGQWANGLVWDILVNPAGGYALQRADGTLDAHAFTILGSNDGLVSASWALVSPDAYDSLADPDAAFPVNPDVMGFLAHTASPSANNAVVNNFAAPSDDVMRGSG